VLIALIFFGVAVIAVAVVVLLRSSRATETRETRNLEPEQVERDTWLREAVREAPGNRIRPTARKAAT
jgi:hypothetical protein